MSTLQSTFIGFLLSGETKRGRGKESYVMCVYLLPEMATYLCKAWGDPRGSWEARTQSTNEFVLVEKTRQCRASQRCWGECQVAAELGLTSGVVVPALYRAIGSRLQMFWKTKPVVECMCNMFWSPFNPGIWGQFVHMREQVNNGAYSATQK